MEESAFLPAVQRIVRRIQVQDDLRRCLGLALQKQIDQQRIDAEPAGAEPRRGDTLPQDQPRPGGDRFAGQRRTVRPLRRELAASTANTGLYDPPAAASRHQ